MRRARGFRLGRKIIRVFSWFIHRRTKRCAAYYPLKPPSSAVAAAAGAISKLRGLRSLLKRGSKGSSSDRALTGRDLGYIRVGQDPDEHTKVCVPKGHLAVYVGEEEDDARRVVVPVIYFNHPLFAELLREAETAFGFDRPGGIQIPCRVSEFENVQSRIAAAGSGDGRNSRRKW